ncbi:uncharacterized protein LOC100740391 isoform X2 [Bombus impatiens]|uniref:Uncharacterized protein LOC100740391 isoform X2 n=1 Tax=Bombus impatiens TaxID=132113 RepID=A0A6P6FDX6_BOMIM|nr:uncharacterized protein LOC100740391 isoform X2 [Bombus impatiens]
MKYFKQSLFLFLFVLYDLVIGSLTEKITLNVNLKEPIAVTDEKFLSLTIDPVTLLAGNALSTDFERSINMAKALGPAYLRFAGPYSLAYFGDKNSQDKEDNRKTILSESDWVATHQWAGKAGLDVIDCISPDIRRKESEESEDPEEIISFSDHMHFNASWQLGYECQIRCDLSADDLGRQTMALRKVLDEFPRYSNSIVTGPDVVAYNTDKQRKYLRDYFSVAAPALSAITWHPVFASITLGNGGAFIHQDNLEQDKEEMFRVIGRFIQNKPLWIAESNPEECKNLFIGALVLTRRLGNAAKINVKVFMRQPINLTRPTPNYWVSLLHKTLVGREVFDAKIQTSNENHVYLYCQCAKASNKYEKGSIVIFGVNLSPEDATINFQAAKITTVHEYVLSPGFDAANRMFAETIFLNNKLLTLTNDTVPEIYPNVLNDTKGVDLRLQSGDIGFWVVPNLQVKSCMESDVTQKKETLVEREILENLGKARDVRIRVTKSVKDQATIKNEKQRQRSNIAIYKSNIKRELKRLRRFVKKKLDDYESRSLLNVRGLSNEETSEISKQPEESVQDGLQEFKGRLLRFKNLLDSSDTKIELKKPISDLITDAISLMLTVQNTLRSMKSKTGSNENRVKSSRSVKESLNTLYDRLTRTNLDESIDPRENKMDQGSKRTKRDLLVEIGESVDSLLRKGPRDDDVEERKCDSKIGWLKNIKKKTRPSLVQFESDDSGESTLRKIFNPVEDFSNDDVFFEDSSLNRDYDYVFAGNSPLNKDCSRNDEQRNRKIEGNSRKKPSKMDYLNDHLWTELDDTDDYPFYDPIDFIEDSRPWNDPMEVALEDSTELSEEQIYEPLKNNEFDNEDESRIMGIESNEDHEAQDDYYESNNFPRNHRLVYGPLTDPDAFIMKTYGSGKNNRAGNEKEFRVVGRQSNRVQRVQGDKSRLKGTNDYYECTDFPKNHRPTYGPLIVPDATVLRYTLTRQPSNKRKNYANEKASSDYYLRSILKGFDFPIEADHPRNKKLKRESKDLHAVLDQEMINEDDANSKNCNCRVIRHSKGRSKREAIESMESEIEQIPKEASMGFRKDIVKSGVCEDADVEVFSEIREELLEKIKSQAEPSKPKIGRDTKTPLQIEASTEHFNANTASSILHDDSDKEEFSEFKDSPIENAESSNESASKKIAQDREEASSEIEKEENIGPKFESNIPSLKSRSDLKFYSQILPTDQSTILDSKERTSSTGSLETLKHDEKVFFHGQSDKKNEENTSTSTTRYTAVDQRYSTPDQGYSTPFVVEEFAKEKGETEEAEEAETRKVESLSTTVKTATLSEGTIEEESENNYDNGNAVGASSKREVKLEQVPHEKVRLANRPRLPKQSKKQTKLNVSKPQESKLWKRIRTLKAIRDLFRKLKESGTISVPRLRPPKYEEQRRNRTERLKQLRKKLSDKVQLTLKKYEKGDDDMVEKEKSEQKRSLRRREVWETVRTSEDFADMIDRERLAYILMYPPMKHDLKRESSTSDEVETIEVPVTEIIRAKNVRQRVFTPDNRRNFRDTTIIEHPNPDKLKEKIIQLTNLYQSKISRGGRSDENKGNDKVYFALVEDVQRPRIFYYEEDPENEGERNMRALSSRPFYNSKYRHNRLIQKPHRESLKAAQYTKEESDEFPGGKEIYIIDPSEYKGGHPSLQLYSPSTSRINSRVKIAPKNKYEVSWDPISSSEPYRIRQTTDKRDGRMPSENSQEPSKSAEKLLQILIENLDSETTDKLFKKLTGRSVADDKGEHLTNSISKSKKETGRRQSEEDEQLEIIFESKENSKESVSMDDNTQGAKGRRKNYRDVSQEKLSEESVEKDEESEKISESRENSKESVSLDDDTQDSRRQRENYRDVSGEKLSEENVDEDKVDEEFEKVSESRENSNQSISLDDDTQGSGRQRGNYGDVSKEKLSEENLDEGKENEEFENISVGRKNSKENVSLDDDTQNSRRQGENYQDVSEEEIQTEREDVSETLIPEENATNANISEGDSEEEATHIRIRRNANTRSKEEYLKSVPSILMRKISKASQKTELDNYLHVKQSPGKISGENPSKLRIEKAKERFNVVPDKKFYGKAVANIKKQIYLTKRSNNDEFKKYRYFPKNLKITSTLPSRSYNSFTKKNSVDPYKKLFEDYQNESDFIEKGSELRKNKKRSVDASYKDGNVSNEQELGIEKKNERNKKSNKEVDLKEESLSNKREVLMVLPWVKRSSRPRRETIDQEKIGKNNKADKVQPFVLQHLDGSYNPKNPISGQIDDVEKSLIQKIPLEKFTAKGNINRRKNIKRNKKDDDGLSSLLQKSIPKLGNVVVNGLNKAENFTGSVEQLILNLDEKYNKTLKDEPRGNSTMSVDPDQSIFHNAIVNVKKFFILLNGITNILRDIHNP